MNGDVIRKGAVDGVSEHVRSLGGPVPGESGTIADRIGDEGGTPLAVSRGAKVLGMIHLKDIVKVGITDRFARFRRHGHSDCDDHGRQSAAPPRRSPPRPGSMTFSLRPRQKTKCG